MCRMKDIYSKAQNNEQLHPLADIDPFTGEALPGDTFEAKLRHKKTKCVKRVNFFLQARDLTLSTSLCTVVRSFTNVFSDGKTLLMRSFKAHLLKCEPFISQGYACVPHSDSHNFGVAHSDQFPVFQQTSYSQSLLTA